MTLEDFCTKTLLYQGSNSKCYLIGKNKDKVLKLFNYPMHMENVDKFKYFLKYKNDSFIFPEEFIIYDNQFLGYVLSRSNGIELKKVFNDLDFVLYSNMSKKLEDDINFISDGLIVMNDVGTRNILYEKDSLKVIDLDFYKIYYNSNKQEVIKYNMNTYKSCITDLFILAYLEIKQKPNKYILQKTKEYLKSDLNVSELIILLKKDLEEYYGNEINNINELKKILRR